MSGPEDNPRDDEEPDEDDIPEDPFGDYDEEPISGLRVIVGG